MASSTEIYNIIFTKTINPNLAQFYNNIQKTISLTLAQSYTTIVTESISPTLAQSDHMTVDLLSNK